MPLFTYVYRSRSEATSLLMSWLGLHTFLRTCRHLGYRSYGVLLMITVCCEITGSCLKFDQEGTKSILGSSMLKCVDWYKIILVQSLNIVVKSPTKIRIHVIPSVMFWIKQIKVFSLHVIHCMLFLFTEDEITYQNVHPA